MESPKTELHHDPTTTNDHESSENNKFRFEPPLFIQRYDYVGEILKTYNCKTYIDIGCAECKLLRYLKNTNQNLNLIVGVDIDKDVLLCGNENLTSSWFDYIQTREQPLEVYLIKTDISNPCNYFIDQACYESTELDCVSMVEIIEHMYPDVLEKAIDTVLGRLNPKLVIITTPNSDFNVVFYDLEKDISQKRPKFRHWDHKFEWTRKEFEDWCSNLLCKYTHYELVKFDGLGCAPEGYTDIGMCSQIAVFKKKNSEIEVNSVTKFKTHLNLKKKLNYSNRDHRMVGKDKLTCDPFFDKDLLDKNEIEPYSVCIQYPFDVIEFENADERNIALFEELDYLIDFLANPHTNSDKYRYSGFNTNDGHESEFEIDQRERIENGLSLCEIDLALCSVEKLFSFSCILKFKIQSDEIIKLMKSNGYEFTKSEKFLIYRHFEDKNSSSWEVKQNENYNDESYDYSAERVSSNSWNEENWDDEIKEPVITVISPREQFADDENDASYWVDQGSEFVNNDNFDGRLNNNSQITDSSYSSLEVLSSIESLMDSFEINYYAREAKELADRFRSIRKSLRRAERQKLKKDLEETERSIEEIEQFNSD